MLNYCSNDIEVPQWQKKRTRTIMYDDKLLIAVDRRQLRTSASDTSFNWLTDTPTLYRVVIPDCQLHSTRARHRSECLGKESHPMRLTHETTASKVVYGVLDFFTMDYTRSTTDLNSCARERLRFLSNGMMCSPVNKACVIYLTNHDKWSQNIRIQSTFQNINTIF